MHYDNAPANTSLLLHEFLAKNKTVKTCVNHLQKTEDTDEWKAFCCDRGDKRKIETGAVGITKKLLSKKFR